LDRKVGGPQSQSGNCGKDRNLTVPGIIHMFLFLCPFNNNMKCGYIIMQFRVPIFLP
jgi:hypothetical protein